MIDLVTAYVVSLLVVDGDVVVRCRLPSWHDLRHLVGRQESGLGRPGT